MNAGSTLAGLAMVLLLTSLGGALVSLDPELPPLPWDEEDPPDPPEAILEPSEEVPWPTWGRGMDRQRALGFQGTPVDPGSLVERDRFSADPGLQLPTGSDGTASYGHVAIADLVEASPGLELVVVQLGFSNLGQPDGGGLQVFSASGELLWSKALEESGTVPMVGDFDADPDTEVFVSSGTEHLLLDRDGSVIWTTETDNPAEPTVSRPVGLDVTGDGILDIVQATRTEDEGPEGALVGFDGPTGQLLFSHPVPCGDNFHDTVAYMEGGEPRIAAGCFDVAQHNGTVQGLAFEPRAPVDRVERVLQHLGLAPTHDAVVVWAHEAGDGEAWIKEMVMADVHPAQGSEIVVLWEDDNRRDGLGFTVLTSDGEVLKEWIEPTLREDAGKSSVTDLDGDGYQDLVTENAGRVDGVRESWVIGYDLGPEAPGLIWRVPGPEEATEIDAAGTSLVDLEGDGRPEVMVGYQGTNFSRSLSGSFRLYDTMDGTELWRKDYHRVQDPGAIDHPTITPARNARIADLDGDGTAEFIYPAKDEVLVFGAPT